MHWLLISARHHPDQGGVGAYVARFCRVAVAAGRRVELITRPGSRHPTGVTVHEVDTPDMHPDFGERIEPLRRIERIRPYRYGLWSLAVAKKLLEIDTRPDVIEFVDCRAEGYVALRSERVRSRHAGVPMIVHAHTPMFVEESINGADAARFGRSVYHEWERRAIAAADGVMAPSRLLRDRLGVGGAAVIPHPLGAAPSDRSTATGEEERIVLVGSVQRRKGVDVWARSLNRVLGQRREAVAVLIGPDTCSAPDGGSMVRHIEEFIDSPLRDRFRWRGELEHDAAMQAIESASLVVVPSRFESFNYVATEAILRGRPVLLSDRVGLAEHVEGLEMVPASDIDALAEAQLRMLAGGNEMSARAGRLRQRLVEACSADRILRKREAFAQSLRPDRATCGAGAEDAMHEMEVFLAGIEQAELSGRA